MSDKAKYPVSAADDRTPGTHVFEGEEKGAFFWHSIAANGRVVAVGGERFTTAEHAWEGVEAAKSVFALHQDLRPGLPGLIKELAFQAAGAGAGVTLPDDQVFPSQEVTEAVERVLADFGMERK